MAVLSPLILVAMIFFVVIGGAVVMLLWNWLLPTLFGWPQITIWQALGLLALCRILFGGFGSRGGYRSRFRHRWKERWNERWNERWAERWGERWERMTPEERERFRRRMRERCGFDPSSPEEEEDKE